MKYAIDYEVFGTKNEYMSFGCFELACFCLQKIEQSDIRKILSYNGKRKYCYALSII